MCVSASAYELRFYTLKYFVFAVYKILGCSPSRYDLERLTCDLCVQSIVCQTHTRCYHPLTHTHTRTLTAQASWRTDNFSLQQLLHVSSLPVFKH